MFKKLSVFAILLLVVSCTTIKSPKYPGFKSSIASYEIITSGKRYNIAKIRTDIMVAYLKTPLKYKISSGTVQIKSDNKGVPFFLVDAMPSSKRIKTDDPMQAIQYSEFKVMQYIKVGKQTHFSIEETFSTSDVISFGKMISSKLSAISKTIPSYGKIYISSCKSKLINNKIKVKMDFIIVEIP